MRLAKGDQRAVARRERDTEHVDQLAQVGGAEVRRRVEVLLEVTRAVHQAARVHAVPDAVHVRDLVHGGLARAVQRDARRDALQVPPEGEDGRARREAREAAGEHVVVGAEQICQRDAHHAEAVGRERSARVRLGRASAPQRRRPERKEQRARVELTLRLRLAVGGADVAPADVLTVAADGAAARVDREREQRQQLHFLPVKEGAAVVAQPAEERVTRGRAGAARVAAGDRAPVAVDGKEVDDVSSRPGHRARPPDALGHRLRGLPILRQPVVDVGREWQRVKEPGLNAGSQRGCERVERGLLKLGSSGRARNLRRRGKAAHQLFGRHRVRAGKQQQLALVLTHRRDDQLDQPAPERRAERLVRPVGSVRERLGRLTVRLDRFSIVVVPPCEEGHLVRLVLVLVSLENGQLERTQRGGGGDADNAA
mmetsp:Transcript_12277/g.21022  ORF Transcript_12277/g.21022 Transcript_12277/m.21022 type:complete len:426 (-) Transcript_12277:102-1379(-)